MVSFHVFGLQECHLRRRKEKKKKKHTHKKKKLGNYIGDPVRGRDAPITSNLGQKYAHGPCNSGLRFKFGALLVKVMFT